MDKGIHFSLIVGLRWLHIDSFYWIFMVQNFYFWRFYVNSKMKNKFKLSQNFFYKTFFFDPFLFQKVNNIITRLSSTEGIVYLFADCRGNFTREIFRDLVTFKVWTCCHVSSMKFSPFLLVASYGQEFPKRHVSKCVHKVSYWKVSEADHLGCRGSCLSLYFSSRVLYGSLG